MPQLQQTSPEMCNHFHMLEVSHYGPEWVLVVGRPLCSKTQVLLILAAPPRWPSFQGVWAHPGPARRREKAWRSRWRSTWVVFLDQAWSWLTALLVRRGFSGSVLLTFGLPVLCCGAVLSGMFPGLCSLLQM